MSRFTEWFREAWDDHPGALVGAGVSIAITLTMGILVPDLGLIVLAVGTLLTLVVSLCTLFD